MVRVLIFSNHPFGPDPTATIQLCPKSLGKVPKMSCPRYGIFHLRPKGANSDLELMVHLVFCAPQMGKIKKKCGKKTICLRMTTRTHGCKMKLQRRAGKECESRLPLQLKIGGVARTAPFYGGLGQSFCLCGLWGLETPSLLQYIMPTSLNMWFILMHTVCKISLRIVM